MNYSVPLIPYTLSGYILAQFDRIMINSYKGSDDAGLYSLAYNIGMLLAVVIGSINAAWMPKYFEYLNREQYTDHDRDVDRIFRIILVVAFFLILFGKQIGFILAKRDYHTGLHIVPIVVAGYIFYGLFTIYGRNIGYVKKTIHSSIVLLVSGAVNVVLNAVFIPRYGYVAAAYTTLLSYFIMAVLAWVINRYVLRMYSTPLKIVVVPLVSIIPFIALFYAVEKSGLTVYITLGIKTVLLVVWVFIMLFKYRKDIMSFLRGQETR
ncbi:MAG: polysaccharide biosynthesis C-terminal domain-containing protein [Spirochaetes bacterium]|nr:polysaccharide biosynthesis C-terminal domain-containing protein [Spirochaetota bacterium]